MKQESLPDIVRSAPESSLALQDWYASPLGQHLLSCEKKQLSRELKSRHGYHLLHLGCANLGLGQFSAIPHRCMIYPETGTGALRPCAIARHEALPITGESADLVLLHHALEFSPNPHQLLREVSRVLVAGGHVVICGFNPVSSWGMRRLLSTRRSHGPWRAGMMTSRRMADWLKLLDFRVVSTHYGAYCWPFNSRRWIRATSLLDRLATRLNWPTGGFYIMTARKQVAPLTMVRQRSSRRFPVSVGIPVAESINIAARGRHAGKDGDTGP